MYRKRPEVLDAIRFNDDAETLEKISDFIGDDFNVSYATGEVVLIVRTQLSTIMLDIGDWLVKNLDGTFSCYTTEMFRKTFENVEE